ELRRILDSEHLEPFAADGDRFGVVLHFRLERSENRIVLGQVRKSLCIRQVIYRDKLDVAAVDSCTDDIPADTAKARNCKLHWHVCGSLLNEKRANLQDIQSRLSDSKVALHSSPQRSAHGLLLTFRTPYMRCAVGLRWFALCLIEGLYTML